MAGKGSSFFGGLVRGFGNQWTSNEREKRDRAQRDKEVRIEVLEKAAQNPDLTDEAKESIWRQIHEITGGVKPTKDGVPGGDIPLQGQIPAIIKAHEKNGNGGQQPSVQQPSMTEKTPIGGSSTQLPPPPPPTGAGPAPAGQDISAPPAPTPVAYKPAAPVSIPQPATSGVNPPPAPPSPTSAPTPAAIGAPPAPPQSHMFLTHQEKMQRQIDDAVAIENAKFKAGEQNKQTTIDNITASLKAANIEVSPQRMQRIIEQVHNIKITGGAVHYGRDQVPVDQIPDDAVDAHSGEPIDKAKIKYVREVYEGNEFKGYTVAGSPKPSATQQKFVMKVDDWKAANPKKNGENDDDYTARGTQTVHAQQYDADSKRIIGLGLRNTATQANIQRIQKELKESGSLSYKSAKVLWDGAWRAARLRAQNDIDSIGRPLHEMVDEELNKLGTGYNEVAEGLRGGGSLPSGGGAQKPSAGGGGVKTADDLAKKLKLTK